MNIIEHLKRREIIKYRKILPAKLYWTGVAMIVIQMICLCWGLVWGSEITCAALSSLSAVMGRIILCSHKLEIRLADKWRSKYFGDTLCLLAVQLVLAFSRPIFS